MKFPYQNREYFYKYTTMDTAHKILKNGTFRYSSPLTFNDPFDIQTELFFPCSIKELPILIINELDNIVLGERTAEFDSTDSWGKIIIVLQQQKKDGKYKKEHIEKLAASLIQYLCDIIDKTRIDYNEHWKRQLATVKVFCVTEHHDNILMWSHYANYHTGVCFKLKAIPGKDNHLCAAKKVEYYPEPPTFFSVENWIDSILLNKEISLPDLYHRYPLVKSDKWVYEDEWRVWAPFKDNGKDYEDFNIIDGEIEAIYFGVRADPKLTDELIAIAKQRGIHKFFQSYKNRKKYSLKFEEI